MLQRIQSVLLLLAALLMAGFLSLKSWAFEGSALSVSVNPLKIVHKVGGLTVHEKPIFYVAVLAALSIALSVFTIFQYRNRVRQLLFVALNSLLIGVALALVVYHIKNDAMPLASNGKFTVGLYLGFGALAANWLANRFIRRDEKLVKDADRMR